MAERVYLEMIALHFPEPGDDARGWGTIDGLGVSPINVVLLGEDPDRLVYMFSSTHWDKVQAALAKSGISYLYKHAPSISKRMVDDPATWLSRPPL